MTNPGAQQEEQKMAKQCKHYCTRRRPGKRYFDARWQCQNKTAHESGYCHLHRWKWELKQERVA